MRSETSMRIAKIGYIILSLALCCFGVFLMINPDVSIGAFGIFTGVALIVFGVIRIIGYFSKDLYRLAFQYDLAFGLLLIALGIMVILKPATVVDTICVAIGIAFLTDGFLKIQISIDAKAFGIRQWWMILTAAILTGVVGILLVFRPSQSAQTLMVFLGIAFLVDGILNLITVLSAVKIIHNQYPDVITEDLLGEIISER